jgi:transposase
MDERNPLAAGWPYSARAHGHRLIIAAEVGDITRFPSARKLAAWAGLTPTVRNSDLTVRYGHISKQGSPWLRWILCEAARTAKRSPEFAATYQRLAHRRGKKTATTAIARRLLTRACHLLRAVQGPHDRKGPHDSSRPPPPGAVPDPG